jgi:ABC-2 type transport system permease protein
MRILAISKKVLKELLRDKRTLAMMFVAPILIMWLMNVMFSASSTTSVIIAAVDVPSSLIENLDDVEHVAVEKYTSAKAAQKDLDNQEVDAILTVDDDTYDVTYANTDSSKTALTRQAIKSVLSWSITNQFMSQVKEAVAETPSLTSLLPTSNVSSTDLTEHYDYGDENTGFFAKMIPILMGFMVFFFVFLISGMALLKERTSGTLDRLLATPVKRSDIVFGYMISYGIIAVIQTVVIVLSTIWLLDIEVVGNIINVIIVNFVLALVALAFGVLLSTLAKSEFQMMQFLPLVIMPQLFFSGIIPLDSMADWVQHIGKILPLSYSGDEFLKAKNIPGISGIDTRALTKIIMYGDGFNSVAFDLLILLMFLVGLTTANIIGLKRYRKV